MDRINVKINKEIDKKLKYKFEFNDYIDNLFNISILAITDNFDIDDRLKLIFNKFYEMFGYEDLIRTNSHNYTKLACIFYICKLLKNEDTSDINSLIINNQLEISLYEEYYLLQLLLKLGKLNKNKKKLLEFIEDRINKMLNNINLINEESYKFIELYIFFNSKKMNCEDIKMSKAYYYYRYLESKNNMYIILLSYLFDEIPNDLLLDFINFESISFLELVILERIVDGNETGIS